MCSHIFLRIILILSLTIVIFSVRGSAAMAAAPCRRCRSLEECEVSPPTLCIWGENRNLCGRLVCSKGPGEKCGEKYDLLGTCGEGLWCSAKSNRCYGCHIPTMNCYPN